MQEFDQLLNQDSEQGCRVLEEGSIISGKVVGIRKTEVFVDLGYKAEGVITLNELAYPTPETAAEAVSEGDTIQALVLSADTSDGNVLLSKLRADKLLAWKRLEAAFAQQSQVDVTVVEAVKGGLSIAIGGIRGFIPASQADVKYVEDLSTLAGQTVSVLPIEVDSSKHRAVFSRKSVLLAERHQQEAAALARLAVGQIVTGTVTRLTDFGVFVDVGGIEGLVHISDLAWHRVKTPQEIVSVGDSVEVVVLKVDSPSKRIALSLKQVQRDPWFDAVEGLAVGMNIGGKVTKISRFGAFVEIKPGVEGLVHISELSDQRVGKVEDVVAPAQTVTVKIIGMDKDNKKLSLSLAQAQAELDQAEYQGYLGGEEGLGTTIGDKLGHLFNRN